jgi:hypothetical protein
MTYFKSILEFELRASCLLDRLSTTWATPPVMYSIFRDWGEKEREKERERESHVIFLEIQMGTYIKGKQMDCTVVFTCFDILIVFTLCDDVTYLE